MGWFGKKLFGKDLFTFQKTPQLLYDFAQHGLVGKMPYALVEYQPILTTSSTEDTTKKPKKTKPTKPLKTPKQLYEMKALHEKRFGINTDPDYLEEQIAQLKEKLTLFGKKPKRKTDRNGYEIGTEQGGVKYSRLELESMIERLENRKKIDSVKSILDTYPHTTSELINAVVDDNANVRCKLATEYISDFPSDAIAAMKNYNNMCLTLCGKTAVFYVIVEKKDTTKKNRKRDPILLAQSPFGFFWSILGAWEKEIRFLEDL